MSGLWVLSDNSAAIPAVVSAAVEERSVKRDALMKRLGVTENELDLLLGGRV